MDKIVKCVKITPVKEKYGNNICIKLLYKSLSQMNAVTNSIILIMVNNDQPCHRTVKQGCNI